ncbi:hypothetical protein NQ318_011873 [Aromia moschata]|uniref:Uncharacterized protein n=1 Tax=Aromia moschata TaxID=1265417 RepID=A0AAV8XI21_9CUCU|nr:hypothetical protein NQ318_011873 [Aromia moschata]
MEKNSEQRMAITFCFNADLSPPDYFLFPKLRMELKGDHFASIQESVTSKLNMIPKEDFSRAMVKLEERANRCI